jgi:hypothetical protein
MIRIAASAVEKRIFAIGAWLSLGGSLLVWLLLGGRQGLSFAAGCALAALNLAWLRRTIGAAVYLDPGRSKLRILLEFLLRLLLIPLCLYAMIRLLFLGAIAATAGFALFYSGVLIEGVLQARSRKPR